MKYIIADELIDGNPVKGVSMSTMSWKLIENCV